MAPRWVWLLLGLLLATAAPHDHAHAHSHGHSNEHSHSAPHDHAHHHAESPAGHSGPTHTDAHLHSHGTAAAAASAAGPSMGSQALLATAAVSILPIFVILFIPLLKTDKKTGITEVNAPLLRTLLAFAVGGLLGDALLHLIPHSLEQSPPQTVGLLTLAGMFGFFLLEKGIRALHHVDEAAACKKDDDHSHGHGHAHGHSHGGNNIAGILNLVADFSHNWTDVMALAASFLTSSAVGFSTTVAIMLHEIPHEVGDYALLVQSGMSLRKALALQFVTAIGAMAGCAMGLVAGDLFEGFQLVVLPFTAGGFIYIALVETVPVLMEGISLSLLQTTLEAAAFAVGVASMVVIALYE